MSRRPKRAATQKSTFKEQKLDLSDLSEMSDDGDFSSESSDDYNPNKSKGNDETFEESSLDEAVSESEQSGDDEEDEDEETTRKNSRSKGSKNNRSTVSTLRKQAINKFGKKTFNTNQSLQDILKKAQYSKKKSVFSQSDSENEKAPNFDCSGGLRLSGSDDSSDDESVSRKKTQKSTIMSEKTGNDLINSINEESWKPMMDLKAIHDNLQKMKHAREKLSKFQAPDNNSAENADDADDNIANLLAMGEKSAGASQKRKKASQADDSDSDNWEEVEEDDSKVHTAPKQDVEILLNSFGEAQNKKAAKPVDIEAQLKRQFNKKRKEFQEYLHKTELMCWIGHYNYLNERLNNPKLMQCALNMLPPSKNKSQYYPKDKTDVEYFIQITKWFKQTITLNNQKMYCNLKKKPPLILSLALQMKYKTAICRRDYILMYIVLLRAIGIQCRMIQSVVLDPKICPKSELMSLSKKEEKELTKTAKKTSGKSSKQSSKKSSSSKSRSKKSSGKLKIPQLDGADDEISRKVSKSRKSIRIKGSTDTKIDESYIDVNKMDKNSTPKRLIKNNGDVENFSPTIKVVLSTSNQNQRLSDKLKKNVKADRLSQLISPRKTRSASREASPNTKRKVVKKTENVEKNSKGNQAEKKNSLQVFSPRRLRDRSTDGNEVKNKSLPAEANKKPNLKALSQQKSPAKHNDGEKPKDTLKVFSPRRLRSRSRSTEVGETSRNDSSRKRESNAKESHAVETKKIKVSENVRASRKRPATRKSDSPIEMKKLKKEDKEEDAFSDDSLKYFKNLSSSSSKKVTKRPSIKESTDEPKPSTSKIDRKILSSDEEEIETKTKKNESMSSPKRGKKNADKGTDIWVEVYSEKEEKWISIDVFRAKIDCVKDICQRATHPLTYVFACNNDNTFKDVSARYCANLNTSVRKMRVDRDYLSSILNIYNVNLTRTHRDFKEDEELNDIQFAVPMPTTFAEFKNHPLYVLKRHLLKYEAIYPPEPPILGYIHDEAIYPRDCCFVLRSRESWVKEARVVKVNEKPYKIAKTLRWDRATNKMLKDIPLELFGIWQTKEYEPPVAENGVVPRNAYGNVEMFKDCMLPIGTVHLELPGLNKICKKLNVDCAQAIVGFDSSGGWPYPVYKGFIICKEFEEKVVDAWAREQEEAEEKEREKFEKRVYGNWKKLIKGLLIRERLMQKYNNFEEKH